MAKPSEPIVVTSSCGVESLHNREKCPLSNGREKESNNGFWLTKLVGSYCCYDDNNNNIVRSSCWTQPKSLNICMNIERIKYRCGGGGVEYRRQQDETKSKTKICDCS